MFRYIWKENSGHGQEEEDSLLENLVNAAGLFAVSILMMVLVMKVWPIN
ncbi:MAG: hypothetical protein K6T66_02020 [Peptococcaceae bacterium]|nr:hypothetical protein [Peptococcaceae bacterium]